MKTSLLRNIAAIGLSIVAVSTVVDACASQPQATITPDRILKGTTPTVSITLDKSIPDMNDVRRVRVAGLVVEVNPPTPEGKIQVPLPRLDIVGKADVEVIGKDDKSVADLQLNY